MKNRMMRLLSLSIVLVLLCSISFQPAAAEEDPIEAPFAGHSILADFPGISWEISAQDLIESFGEETFDNEKSNLEEGSGMLEAVIQIDDEEINVDFYFSKDHLTMMIIAIPGTLTDLLINEYTELYGEPFSTAFISIMMGMLKPISNGNAIVWQMDSIHYVSITEIGVIYTSLK